MTPKQLTVGVLGHVDHGKTALVKTLTGVDTDRLEEEQRRGMSIVLGFAYWECAQGVVDFIDVPGHEKFIRTMISGATGIDAVLLVVAADEGIKPQTREHFAIAQLLGIKQGLIVVTKSDLIEERSRKLIEDELKAGLEETFLQDAPIYHVSNMTGNGVAELQLALEGLISARLSRRSADTFYLPLDRVFSIDGYGTVATGTLRNGSISCDDEVEILPMAIKAKIRELQVHNTKVDSAVPGQRVAVNLRGVRREQLQRGNILTKPGALKQTKCLHARLHFLDDLTRVPKRNETVRLLFGTHDVLAKIRAVELITLAAGVSLLVLFRCRESVIVSAREHFVIRTCSPAVTIGGGQILDTSEKLLQFDNAALIQHLQALEKSGEEGRIIAHLQAAGMQGIARVKLAKQAIVSSAQVDLTLNKINAVVLAETTIVDRTAWTRLINTATQAMQQFHDDNPESGGENLEIFRSLLIELSSVEIVEYLIEALVDGGIIKVEDNVVRLAEFNQNSGLSSDQLEFVGSIAQIYRDSGVVTPSESEATGADPGRKWAFQYLRDAGVLISMTKSHGSNQVVFHKDTVEQIMQQLKETYPPPGKFTVSDFRQMIGSSRKYVIPMLEYFDRNQTTLRVGDYRILSARAVLTES